MERRPVYSPSNRITADMIRAKCRRHKLNMCCGAWGTQSDIQCLGYDALCGLAVLFYDPLKRYSSDDAVYAARAEVEVSPYSRGFQLGWDTGVRRPRPKDPPLEGETKTGYDDGVAARKSFDWQHWGGSNDGAWR